MLAGTPVILLREGSERTQGSDARRAVVQAARAVANSVRSTLGPRGRDKMLVDSLGDVVITNDGVTILERMEVQHPAAKMLVEVAKAQDQECGDGTKTSVILVGELLRRAEELLDDKVHPTLVVRGYQIAAEKAIERLRAVARPVRRDETETLERIARTSMISKGVGGYRASLSALAVRAVTEVLDEHRGRPTFDRKNIQFVKRQGGEVQDSELVLGHIVEQGALHSAMPKTVRPARLALLEAPLEVKKTEFGVEIKITEAQQVQAFLDEEARMLRTLVDAIVRAGANVVICEKGVDDLVSEQLARAGVYVVRRAKRTDLELLARATGGRLVARPVDLGPDDLGHAGGVEERKIGEDRLTVVSDCPHAKAVTVLLRGGTQHVVDEVERSLVDAVMTVGTALEDGRILTGAGATAAELGLHLRAQAPSVGGREQLAVEAFADALEIIPTTLAENAGMNTMDTVLELRRRHQAGEVHAGVNVLEGRVDPMDGVAVEPFRLARQVVVGATEACAILLRIDDVVASRRAPGASASAAAPSASTPAEAFA